ncbi:hypothetical protein LCM10_10490 [Rossellomorea aquimaris]|nr:hypothetical protein [Rossellomorea aquimaris]MCA1055413.1 hypothetical protein [Rossellomorea aquimaris]
MIGVQGEDSCGKRSLYDTPQLIDAPGWLTGDPREAKPCTEINSGISVEK